VVGQELARLASSAGLAVALLVGGAAADELCGRLTVPAELGLACVDQPGDPPRAVVGPTGGAFAALSQLTLRRLDRARDAVAWDNPDGWLRGQLEIDTSGVADAFGSLADDPDSPWAGPTAALLAERVREALASVGKAALGNCDPPRDALNGRAMSCRFGGEGVGLLLDLRLVPDGEERWAIHYRSMNAQRQRHFEAIANSFRAG
jgi:hypothetical protein